MWPSLYEATLSIAPRLSVRLYRAYPTHNSRTKSFQNRWKPVSTGSFSVKSSKVRVTKQTPRPTPRIKLHWTQTDKASPTELLKA